MFLGKNLGHLRRKFFNRLSTHVDLLQMVVLGQQLQKLLVQEAGSIAGEVGRTRRSVQLAGRAGLKKRQGKNINE